MAIYLEETDPNTVEKTEEQLKRESIIDEINLNIKEFGNFNVYDVEADHSPCVNSLGRLVGLMEDFREGGGTVYVYDPTSHSSDEIDAYDELYEELETSQLEYILELTQIWAELNEE